jgi:large subunit ribosomal protein L29
MAIINKEEMGHMSVEDAQVKIEELRKELLKENAVIAGGTTPKSPGKVRQMKKTIARLMTKINKEKKNK